MAKLYEQGYSSNEISKMYGYKTRNSVLQKLDRLGIKRRSCNEIRIKEKSYFNFNMNEIDTEEKAYFLGLLITDGYINKERGYIGIDLTDEDAIQFLVGYINAEYSVIPPKGKAKLTKYRIILYGRELCNSVDRLGVIYKKTYYTKGPNLNKDELCYLNYILRGIIDGDGWIRKDGKEFFICSASREFIKWIQAAMLSIGFEDINISFLPNNYNGIYLIRTASYYNLELLRNNVYNKPFGMMRKYNRLYRKDVQRL